MRGKKMVSVHALAGPARKVGTEAAGAGWKWDTGWKAVRNVSEEIKGEIDIGFQRLSATNLAQRQGQMSREQEAFYNRMGMTLL